MFIRHLNRPHMTGRTLSKLTCLNRIGIGGLRVHRSLRNSPSRELASGARGWTQDDVRKLIELRTCGSKSQAIAEQLGRSTSAIYSSIRRLRPNEGLEVQAPDIVPQRQHAWTEDDDITLKILHREGKTGLKIAKTLERSKLATHARLHTLGLSTKRGNTGPRPPRRSQAEYERVLELRAAGNRVRHIAELTGLSDTTVKRWITAGQKRPGRLTAEEVQKIRDMRDRGESIATICAALPDRSYNTVSVLIARLVKEGSIASRARSWSEEDKQKLLDLRKAGVPFKTIATQIPGRSETALRRFWSKWRESWA